MDINYNNQLNYKCNIGLFVQMDHMDIKTKHIKHETYQNSFEI